MHPDLLSENPFAADDSPLHTALPPLAGSDARNAVHRSPSAARRPTDLPDPPVHPVRLPPGWFGTEAAGEPGRNAQLAAVAALAAATLARYTDADRVALSVLAAGPDGRTLPVIVDTAGERTLPELAAAVEKALRTPDDRGGDLTAGGPPRSLSHADGDPVAGAPAIRVTESDTPGHRPAAEPGCLTLVVTRETPEPAVFLLAPTGSPDPGAAGRLAGHLAVLAEAAAAEPRTTVTALPLLTRDEQRLMLVEWNRTDFGLPHDRCLHEHFQDRAAARPDDIAVRESGRATTFAEVNRRANRLARRLIALGTGPGSVVGISLQRSTGLLVAVLAVLKAGGCYLPMDPAYPPERLALLRRDGRCDVVITDTATATALPAGPGCLLLTDAHLDESADAPEDDLDPPSRCTPDDLCYVIHTSGSTGEPKGIELRHRGVVNNLTDLNRRFHIGPGDSVLTLSSPGFDMSVYEFLGITLAGGTAVVPEPDGLRRPAHWAELMLTHQITVWNSAPALLELLVEHAERTGLRLPDLRLAMLGGDWIGVTLPDRLYALAPAARCAALGGATESSIHSTLYQVPRSGRPDWSSIPYGRPLANQRVYILDPAGLPVPVGVPGELHLAGTGLARGYAHKERLTADRFITWTHPVVGRERLYRTGDLARYHGDGLVELLGRLDFQVKIGGVRVELGEIEHNMRRIPDVRHAVAVAVGPQGGRRLVGYVVPRHGCEVAPEAVSRQLAAWLPAAMVPHTVVVLDALPLSPNGKVDRGRLASAPASAPVATARTAASAAGRETPGGGSLEERRVAEVWAQVLDVPPPGPDADFFALGGDSFRAIRAMSILAPDLPPVELLRYSTVSTLAARLRAANQP